MDPVRLRGIHFFPHAWGLETSAAEGGSSGASNRSSGGSEWMERPPDGENNGEN